MIKRILKNGDLISIASILFCVFLFFYPFFLQKKLPIPADTVIGLYNPFRDLYAKDYPNGIPYKNFLLTDPVRQQYIWKELSVDMLSLGQLPLWNPYEMSGTPLLANFQSGVFYPLNILLFLKPFSYSWSFFIFLQMILAGVFMYLYLRVLKLSHSACVLGSVTWMFSGFFVAWLEWGNIIHTVLWLPLILLSMHKLLESKGRKELIWFFILIASSCFSFFAGHLQSFFYIVLLLVPYTFSLWFVRGRNFKKLFSLLTYFVIFITLTSIQWVPTLQFIDLSGRAQDQAHSVLGWFIPYENLVQFVAPDFLGNPATLNYFGVFNYGEFVGYVGIVSLILFIYACFFRRDKKTTFFITAFLVGLLFATYNPISVIPFILKIPFIATAQPTRLLLIMCFSMSVLASLGLDLFIKRKSKIISPILLVGVFLACLWGSTIFLQNIFPSVNDAVISQRNLRLPTILYVLSSVLFIVYSFKNFKKLQTTFIVLILFLAVADLLRFGWKYTPFVDSRYVFPETKILSYLQTDKSLFRVAATDNQILPPNFPSAYKIASVEGYDPLYLHNYASVIAANERSSHSIQEPYGFNRIITLRNIDSPVVDFLNVKYILSFNTLGSKKYNLVMEEGKTKLYKNKESFPRVFFVEHLKSLPTKSEIAKSLFTNDLHKTAFILGDKKIKSYVLGKVDVVTYTPNKIILKTENKGVGFLVMSDVSYPSFRAKIDGQDAGIVVVNNAFRGIEVPLGAHMVTLTGGLF